MLIELKTAFENKFSTNRTSAIQPCEKKNRIAVTYTVYFIPKPIYTRAVGQMAQNIPQIKSSVSITQIKSYRRAVNN